MFPLWNHFINRTFEILFTFASDIFSSPSVTTTLNSQNKKPGLRKSILSRLFNRRDAHKRIKLILLSRVYTRVTWIYIFLLFEYFRNSRETYTQSVYVGIPLSIIRRYHKIPCDHSGYDSSIGNILEYSRPDTDMLEMTKHRQDLQHLQCSLPTSHMFSASISREKSTSHIWQQRYFSASPRKQMKRILDYYIRNIEFVETVYRMKRGNKHIIFII